MGILRITIKDKNHLPKSDTYQFHTNRNESEIFTHEYNDSLSCRFKFNPDFLSYCYKNMHWLWEAYLINRTIQNMEFIEDSNIEELGY